MARPPLPFETWGRISITGTPGAYRARARYRDIDGRTRLLERSGATKAKAENALREAMRDRLKPSGETIDRSSRVETLAEVWFEEWSLTPHPVGTVERYQRALRGHIVAEIGGWTIGEATVGKLDRYVKALTKSAGYSTADIVTVLLQGMFDLAARHEAIDTNPARSIARVVKPNVTPVRFSLDDVAEVRQLLFDWDNGRDRSGRRRVSDLADPVDFFLGTGCRPGEVFAVTWPYLSLVTDPPVAEIRGTVARDPSTGKRFIQPRLKNGRGRILLLPDFTVEMLIRRRVDSISELVFPSSTGTLRVPDNFRTQWHLALEGTRFEGCVPKQFRSTVAAQIRVVDGLDAAQQQLDHSDSRTTRKHYAPDSHIGPDVRAALQQFNVKAMGK